MKKLAKELMALLQIHSPSGSESKVAAYLYVQLKNLMGDVTFDSYGNLLAQKKYGDSGYTVLLSAHMDTVAHVPPIPTWRKGKKEIYTQSTSALGGDDKCGLAAHLAVIRQLNKQTDFKGTIKVCFSREEEAGCIGAEEAVKRNPEWFNGIDAAIVIDRRGGYDVVDSNGWNNFCSDGYADFWLDMAEETGFCAAREAGTISDTMVFSELGINGVNLSAGYYNAHTAQEYIVMAELRRTTQWVINALNHIEDYGKFPAFDYEEKSTRALDYFSYLFKDNYSGRKDDDELAYCEDCDMLFSVSDMTIDEDDRIVCTDCYEFMQMPVDCDNCLQSVKQKHTVYRHGANICSRCVTELLIAQKS